MGNNWVILEKTKFRVVSYWNFIKFRIRQILKCIKFDFVNVKHDVGEIVRFLTLGRESNAACDTERNQYNKIMCDKYILKIPLMEFDIGSNPIYSPCSNFYAILYQQSSLNLLFNFLQFHADTGIIAGQIGLHLWEVQNLDSRCLCVRLRVKFLIKKLVKTMETIDLELIQ